MEDQEEVWAVGHAESVLSQLCSQFQRQLLCDLTLSINGQTFLLVHKAVLVACSGYFKKLLQDGWLAESTHLISNTDVKAAQSLVQFMYEGRLLLDKDNVLTMVAVATRWEVPAAVELCQNYLQKIMTAPLGNLIMEYQQKIESGCLASGDTCIPGDGEFQMPAANFVQEEEEENQAVEDKEKEKSGRELDHQSVMAQVEDKNMASLVADIPDDLSDDAWMQEAELKVTHATRHGRSVDQAKVTNRGTGKKRGRPRKKSTFQRNHKSQKKNIQVKEEEGLSETTKKMSMYKTYKRKNDQMQEPCKLTRAQVKKREKQKELQKKELICCVCAREYTSPLLLKYHKMKEHKSLLYMQLYMRRRLLTKIHNIQWITRSVQGNVPPFTCTLCGKEFELRSRYISHCKKIHCKISCHYCSRVVCSKQALWNHRLNCSKQNAKPGNKKFVCGFCGRPFLYRQNVMLHLRQNHSAPASVCKVCGKAFQQIKKFECHLTLHNLKPSLIAKEVAKFKASLTGFGQKSSKQGTSAKWKCVHCGRLYKTKSSLKQHVMKAHPVNNGQDPGTGTVTRATVFPCEEKNCSLVFRFRQPLEDHMEKCHPGVIYTCSRGSNCRFKTRINSQMVKHVRLRHDTDRSATCEICGKFFRKKYYLKIHKYSKHKIKDDSVKAYGCTFPGCDYVAFARINLEKHSYKHCDAKPFTCDVCGKNVKTKENLEKHINKVHKKIRPYMCDICGADYGEEAELKTHMARHGTNKPFKCPHCDYASYDKGNYQSHLFAKHKIKMNEKQRIFRCTLCDYSTDRKTRFNEHADSHLEVRQYVCTICGKGFITKSTLKGHYKWVHKEKNFHCDYCDHATSDMHHLREHMRVMHTHRDIKPFKCFYCEFRCATSGNCRKHCANKHKDMEIRWVKVCDKYAESNPVAEIKNNGTMPEQEQTCQPTTGHMTRGEVQSQVITLQSMIPPLEDRVHTNTMEQYMANMQPTPQVTQLNKNLMGGQEVEPQPPLLQPSLSQVTLPNSMSTLNMTDYAHLQWNLP